MPLFENFELDITLLIKTFCLTCLTYVQQLCVDNAIVFIILFDMFNI